MTSTYTNIHRGFLQSCAQHGTLTMKRALKILGHLYQQHQPEDPVPDEDILRQVMQQINVRLARCDQKIVEISSDPKQPTYIVYANLSDAPANHFQTTYKDGELSFFRVILHKLAKTEGHCVSQIECLNLTSKIEAGRSVAKSRAEELVSEWKTQGYLVLKDGEILLGPKTVVEFDRYLLNNFADQIRPCRLCKEILLYGATCEKCKECFHKTCIAKYLNRMKNCPACKVAWTIAKD